MSDDCACEPVADRRRNTVTRIGSMLLSVMKRFRETRHCGVVEYSHFSSRLLRDLEASSSWLTPTCLTEHEQVPRSSPGLSAAVELFSKDQSPAAHHSSRDARLLL